MKKLLPIGNIELVSLPDDQIQHVPAKIDTGADSSAIWASNVKLANGKLSFNFFAPGSAYYNEQPIITSAFKVISVKNSFGQNETRYKIRLKISIGKYTLTRWFSLADRSRNTYPILLGKNFLRGRFLVDVSKKYLVSKGLSAQAVLVLGANSSQNFFEQVRKNNTVPVNYDCIGYGSLIYFIDGLASKVVNSEADFRDIATYTLTYFKSRDKHMEFALSAALYLHFKGKPFTDQELGSSVSLSKLTQYMKLASYGLPVPVTICAKTSILKEYYSKIVERLGSPFVLKEIYSDRGTNNYLIRNAKEFRKILAGAPAEHTYVAQQYVENDGFLRLYITGREIGLAVWRSAHLHADSLKAHLNKPAGSINAEQRDVAELPLDIQELAIKAATCMNRQIAGVDLVQDKHSGVWYILEVNSGPQLRSGSFLESKREMMAKFFDKELQR